MIEQELKIRLLSWITAIEHATDQNDLYGLKTELDAIKLHFHNMTIDDMPSRDESSVAQLVEHETRCP
jgi:hypothetical protein